MNRSQFKAEEKSLDVEEDQPHRYYKALKNAKKRKISVISFLL